MGSNDMPELGSKISLISKADIRYEGKLFTVDPQDCTIALANVRSFGTEDRVTDHPVPAQAQVYDYILFRATDIKDISVIPSPPVLFDPAIVQLSVPPSLGPNSGSMFQSGFQHSVLGQLGGSSNSDSTPAPVGSMLQSSSGYTPMLSSGLLSSLHNRSRQTSESQRHPSGSVAELLSGVGSEGPGAVSRSSTPGIGKRMTMPVQGGSQSSNQRQSTPPRYNDQQRNRNNSQSNSSNHDERSYGSRQYSQTKPQRDQPQRYGNRSQDNNGYIRDNRNDNNYGNHRGNNDMYGNSRGSQQMPMQQRGRYHQGNNMQHNQRSNSRGGSGDRMQDQGQRMGMRRNQGGWSQNTQRQGGGQRMQGQQNRGGRPRGQFGFNLANQAKQAKQPLKFDSDYDFDKANTEFEELRLSLSQIKVADGNQAVAAVNQAGGNATDDKKDDSGNETAVGECDQEDEGVSQVNSAYDKTKSFFDNISCEAIERSKGRSQRTDWRKELKLNTETFGVSVSRRYFYPRGRGYYRGGNNSWNFKPRQQNNIIAAKV